MKYFLASLTCIVLFQFSKAQDSLRRYEFGSTLVTCNLYKQPVILFQYRPPQEFLNGIFFRYSKNRLGIRATLSYATNYSSFGGPSDPYSSGAGTLSLKDIRAGCGGQYTVLRKFSNLYLYSDLAYRQVISKGNISGGIAGINDNYMARTHGLDAHFGLGFKIKIFRILYVSPEFSYNIAYGSGTGRYESATTKQGYESKYKDQNANPVLRLHVSVSF